MRINGHLSISQLCATLNTPTHIYSDTYIHTTKTNYFPILRKVSVSFFFFLVIIETYETIVVIEAAEIHLLSLSFPLRNRKQNSKRTKKKRSNQNDGVSSQSSLTRPLLQSFHRPTPTSTSATASSSSATATTFPRSTAS